MAQVTLVGSPPYLRGERFSLWKFAKAAENLDLRAAGDQEDTEVLDAVLSVGTLEGQRDTTGSSRSSDWTNRSRRHCEIQKARQHTGLRAQLTVQQ